MLICCEHASPPSALHFKSPGSGEAGSQPRQNSSKWKIREQIRRDKYPEKQRVRRWMFNVRSGRRDKMLKHSLQAVYDTKLLSCFFFSIAVFCFTCKTFFPHLYFPADFLVTKSLCSRPLFSLWRRAKTQQVHFLMYSPPDRANVERERRAKLEGIQINSSAWEGSALHFFFFF